MAESTEKFLRLMTVVRNSRPSVGRLWSPSADVVRTPDGWLVVLELAGVCPEETVIKIEGSTLHVEGCRRDAFYSEGVSYEQLEITYSRFERTIKFPRTIENARLKRDYRDGLLVIHLQTG